MLADILLGQGREILAVICPNEISARGIFAGIPHLTRDEDILQFAADSVLLVNGIGMLPHSTLRRRINLKFLEKGYCFETVIANDAKVSSFAEVKSGAQILNGARVHTGAVIAEHTIINTCALIEHDCHIGAYTHVAPKATVCGEVWMAEDVYIGANATLIQGLMLGPKSIVGAGAILTQSLNEGEICFPARSLIKERI